MLMQEPVAVPLFGDCGEEIHAVSFRRRSLPFKVYE